MSEKRVEELTKLLREAREFILRFGKVEEDHNLRDRIDATLVERLDSATPVVEWQMTNWPIGTMYAYVNGADLRVRWDGQNAAWDATHYGREADEKTAKAAAIAAARGVR